MPLTKKGRRCVKIENLIKAKVNAFESATYRPKNNRYFMMRLNLNTSVQKTYLYFK